MKSRLLLIFLLISAPLYSQSTTYGSVNSGITVVGVQAISNLVLPNSVLLPSVQVGSVGNAVNVTLTNSGSNIVTLNTINIPSGPNTGDFTQTNNCPTLFGGGFSCSISVVFKPTASGTRSANLVVTSSIGIYTCVLSGVGISGQPIVLLSTNTVNFPDTKVGIPSATQNVNLTNIGTTPLNFSFALGGTNSGDFSFTTDCSTVLGVNGVCHYTITFTPTTSGSRTAKITITSNAPSTPDIITLNGNGIASSPLTILTTSLPNGNVSASYSTSLSGTGGTPPYVWSITSGSLSACNLSLASNGNITGTPSVATSCTVTYKLSDTVCVGIACPTISLTITINAALIGDNAYCPVSEVSTLSNTFDHGAQLLTNCLNTQMVNTTGSGSSITVTPGSATDLQSKFNTVQCGQTIIIPSNTSPGSGVQAVYNGSSTFIFPALKCAAGTWVTVRTDLIGSIPSEGNRITPSFAGYDYPRTNEAYPAYTNAGVHGVYIPKVMVTNAFLQPVITVTAGASHIHFIGLELTNSGTTNGKNMMISNSGTDHVFFDRVWLHPNNSFNEHNTVTDNQGYKSDSSTYTGIVDSRIADFFCQTGPTGFDCVEGQGITGGNGTGGGPFKYVNNFLATAGESYFLGGGSGVTGVPQDIEIRLNHTFQPLFWFYLDPTWDTIKRSCKNLGELKTGDRVLIEGNIFGSSSPGTCVDQVGFISIIGPKNQSQKSAGGTASTDGSGTITWISGPIYTTALTDPGCAIPGHCHMSFNKSSDTTYTVQTLIDSHHIIVSPAPPAIATAPDVLCFAGGGPGVYIRNVTYRYNRLQSGRYGIQLALVQSDCGDIALGLDHVSIHDTISDDIGPQWAYNAHAGGCCQWGSGIVIDNFPFSPNEMHDVSIINNTWLPLTPAGFAVGFLYQVGYNDYTTANPTILPNFDFKDNIGVSGLHGAVRCASAHGTLAVLQCEHGTTYCYAGNVIASNSITGLPTNGAQTPFPTTGGSTGSCPGSVSNFNPVDYTAIQFVNLNNAVGGDYHLSNTSPYKSVGTNGADPGANVDLVNQFTTGVQ